jgi:hypothetical protein
LILFLFTLLGLRVYPTTVEVSFEEIGKTYKGYITVYNKGDKGVYIKVNVFDFGIDEEDGSPLPLPLNSTPYSIFNYLKLEPDSFYLEKGKEAKVKYILNSPPQPGNYYGIVIFSTSSPNKKFFGSGIDIGVNFLITAGNKNFLKRAKIEYLETYKINDDIQIVYKVSNVGETHLRIKTFLEIKDDKGNSVKKYEPKFHTFLIPNTSRIFKFIFEKPRKGEYIAFAFITYEDEYELKEKKFFVK